jgi:hypothetical protein
MASVCEHPQPLDAVWALVFHGRSGSGVLAGVKEENAARH